jgi:hypothetical protein
VEVPVSRVIESVFDVNGVTPDCVSSEYEVGRSKGGPSPLSELLACHAVQISHALRCHHRAHMSVSLICAPVPFGNAAITWTRSKSARWRGRTVKTEAKRGYAAKAVLGASPEEGRTAHLQAETERRSREGQSRREALHRLLETSPGTHRRAILRRSPSGASYVLVCHKHGSTS